MQTAFAEDDGRGFIRLLYFERGSKKILNSNVGTVNYKKGRVSLSSNFVPISIDDGSEVIRFTAIPDDQDILATNNLILTYDEEDSSAISVSVTTKSLRNQQYNRIPSSTASGLDAYQVPSGADSRIVNTLPTSSFISGDGSVTSADSGQGGEGVVDGTVLDPPIPPTDPQTDPPTDPPSSGGNGGGDPEDGTIDPGQSDAGGDSSQDNSGSGDPLGGDDAGNPLGGGGY